MAERALLLDRDGVINVDTGYVGRREDFTFIDGIFPLARRAVATGRRIVVITNQSGIARGYYDEADFRALSDWMAGRFAAEGAPLTGVLHCPHLADAAIAAYRRDSFWRKPKPGMILEAARRFDLDLARSLFIGDKPGDMEAAAAAGVGCRVLFDANLAVPPHPATGHLISDLTQALPLLTPPGPIPPATGWPGSSMGGGSP